MDGMMLLPLLPEPRLGVMCLRSAGPLLAVCEAPVINSAREDAARPGCGSPSALSPVWGPLAGRPTDRASGTGRQDRYGKSRRRRELPRPIASPGVFPRETQG